MPTGIRPVLNRWYPHRSATCPGKSKNDDRPSTGRMAPVRAGCVRVTLRTSPSPDVGPSRRSRNSGGDGDEKDQARGLRSLVRRDPDGSGQG